MLRGGLDSPDVATLVFCIAAAVLALAAAGQPASARKTGIVALPLTLLAIFVLLRHGFLALTGVLLLGAFGEMLLVQERPAAYVSGLGVELAVRAVYAVLFVVGSHAELFASQLFRPVVALLILIGAVWLMRRLWPFAGPLRWPAVVYAAVVVVMCAAAAAVRPPWVLLGAVLLAASDGGLAADRFLRPTDKEMPLSTVRLTWLARLVGPALIVFSALRII